LWRNEELQWSLTRTYADLEMKLEAEHNPMKTRVEERMAFEAKMDECKVKQSQSEAEVKAMRTQMTAISCELQLAAQSTNPPVKVCAPLGESGR
jgi:hypothetical protein